MTQLALGSSTSCALKGDGSLWCWGDNEHGQLGNGTTTDSPTPIPVSSLGTSVIDASLGSGHTCARLVDDSLSCWGRNSNGQLGVGTMQSVSTPTPVSALGTMVDVIAGRTGAHTCAGLADGSLWCWGWNMYGQVGDGTTVNKSSPVEVLGTPASVVSIGGDIHTCAAFQGGMARCWGLNDFGQLGNGTTTDSPTPVAVSTLNNVAEIDAGYPFSCARTTDSRVYCWGGNYAGQLGDGTTVSKSSPTEVAALGNTVEDLAVGGEHACARKSDGTLWCWGHNNVGQLGDGTTDDKTSPVQVMTLGTSVVEVAAGGLHTCARTTDDKVYCWGLNSSGQLGDGTTVDKSSPAPLGLCP